MRSYSVQHQAFRFSSPHFNALTLKWIKDTELLDRHSINQLVTLSEICQFVRYHFARELAASIKRTARGTNAPTKSRVTPWTVPLMRVLLGVCGHTVPAVANIERRMMESTEKIFSMS